MKGLKRHSEIMVTAQAARRTFKSSTAAQHTCIALLSFKSASLLLGVCVTIARDHFSNAEVGVTLGWPYSIHATKSGIGNDLMSRSCYFDGKRGLLKGQ